MHVNYSTLNELSLSALRQKHSGGGGKGCWSRGKGCWGGGVRSVWGYGWGYGLCGVWVGVWAVWGYGWG